MPKSWPRLVKPAIVHALALAHWILTHVRGWAADSPLVRVRLAVECDRLRSEVAMLREELRIKDARLARIPARNRPHYPPAERLAILALKAARGWNGEQAAARFLLTGATIASWMGRLEEQGEAALVRMATPVNRFPDFVRAVVTRLGASFPTLGSMRIANLLARAGLHLARTTVRRLRAGRPDLGPAAGPDAATAGTHNQTAARHPPSGRIAS